MYYESKKKKTEKVLGSAEQSTQADQRISRKLDWRTETHRPRQFSDFFPANPFPASQTVKILRLESSKFSLEILAGNNISLVYLFCNCLPLYSKGFRRASKGFDEP